MDPGYIQIFTTKEDLKELLESIYKVSISSTHKQSIDNSLEEPITGEELCKFLKITIPTLISWRKKGKIPFLKIGRRLLYQKSQVVNALSSTKKGVNNASKL